MTGQEEVAHTVEAQRGDGDRDSGDCEPLVPWLRAACPVPPPQVGLDRDMDRGASLQPLWPRASSERRQ